MRCFTVLGPSQTGKSTVVEKLGSLEGAPRKSSSPYGLNLTEFTFGNEAWCALDAPGPGRSAGACAARASCQRRLHPVRFAGTRGGCARRALSAGDRSLGNAVHPLRQPDGRTERAAQGRDRRASGLRQPHPSASPDPDPRRGQDRRQLRSDFGTGVALPGRPDVGADRDPRKRRRARNTKRAPNSWSTCPNSMTGFSRN